MQQIAGGEGKAHSDDEGRVRRAPIKFDARHKVENGGEERRIAADGVKDRGCAKYGEKSQTAPEQPAAGNTVPQQQQGGQGTDEKIIDGAVGPVGGDHGLVARPPIIVAPMQRAEEVGRQHRDEINRRERPRSGDAKGNSGPVGGAEKLHGEQRRHGEQRTADDHAQRQNQAALSEIGERPARAKCAGRNGTDNDHAKQKGDLVASLRHHGRASAEGRCESHDRRSSASSRNSSATGKNE